ncbi:MAG: type II toxin-antitoxin system RelE/ParE family toxin [Ardenticatenaceae bacterium]|nr:type II toxin-antitoxin system RelE/ParE family toxin [Ardenticatenaceae bacterium]
MKYEIETTQEFEKWLRKIRDKTILHRFDIRFNRLAKGNFGDAKQIAVDLFELRFFFGSGYRVYYTIKNNKVVILLCGGDKSTQRRDIAKAQSLLSQLR